MGGYARASERGPSPDPPSAKCGSSAWPECTAIAPAPVSLSVPDGDRSTAEGAGAGDVQDDGKGAESTHWHSAAPRVRDCWGSWPVTMIGAFMTAPVFARQIESGSAASHSGGPSLRRRARERGASRRSPSCPATRPYLCWRVEASARASRSRRRGAASSPRRGRYLSRSSSTCISHPGGEIGLAHQSMALASCGEVRCRRAFSTRGGRCCWRTRQRA